MSDKITNNEIDNLKSDIKAVIFTYQSMTRQWEECEAVIDLHHTAIIEGNRKLKQAMVDNCPTSMVQCECGLYYKQPGESVCTTCRVSHLEKCNTGQAARISELEESLARSGALLADIEAKLDKAMADLATSQAEANDLRVRVEGLLLEIEGR